MFRLDYNLPTFPNRSTNDGTLPTLTSERCKNNMDNFVAYLGEIARDAQATVARAIQLQTWCHDQEGIDKPFLHPEDYQILNDWIVPAKLSTKHVKTMLYEHTPLGDPRPSNALPNALVNAHMAYMQRLNDDGPEGRKLQAQREKEFQRVLEVEASIHKDQKVIHDASKLLVKCGEALDGLKIELYNSAATTRVSEITQITDRSCKLIMKSSIRYVKNQLDILQCDSDEPENNKKESEEDKSDDNDQKSDDNDQKSDDDEQKSDGNDQKSDDNDRKSDDNDQKSDDNEQKSDDNEQKSDDNEQKSDDNEQKSDDNEQKSDDNEQNSDENEQKSDDDDQNSNDDDQKSDSDSSLHSLPSYEKWCKLNARKTPADTNSEDASHPQNKLELLRDKDCAKSQSSAAAVLSEESQIVHDTLEYMKTSIDVVLQWKEEYGSQAQLPETLKLDSIRQLGSMFSNVQSLCVELDNSKLCDSPLPDTDQHTDADKQEVTDPVQEGVIMQNKSEDQDQPANPEQDSSAVPDQKEANVVDISAPTTEPCMEVVLHDQKTEISAPPVVETDSDSEEEIEDTRNYDFAQLAYSEKYNLMKQLLLATLPYFLSAIEDVRSGRRQPQNAHFNEQITGFLKFVKKAKNDKKTKDGFKNFKPVTFIEQQYEKSRVSKKNELLYDTLGTYLSQQKYEQPIIELLYYFSEKKFFDAEPAESTIGNLMQGLEHYFFFHVVEWLKHYWKQSFEDYVKRQETILRDLTSKVLPNRYRPRRRLANYKKTPFFRARVMAHSKLVAVSPAMFMIQKAYALLQTTKVESKILDSDIDFLKTNCTKCDEDNIALEYELFSEILCTNDSVLQF